MTAFRVVWLSISVICSAVLEANGMLITYAVLVCRMLLACAHIESWHGFDILQCAYSTVARRHMHYIAGSFMAEVRVRNYYA